MDSAGIGELPDAAVYGDEGSNTIGNIHTPDSPAASDAPQPRPRSRRGSRRLWQRGAAGAFGRMAERSPGKDSVTGHWEMAGLVLDRPFPTFPQGFPPR